MRFRPLSRLILPFVFIFALVLSACSPRVQPGQPSAAAPTPLESTEASATQQSAAFVDPDQFETALLQALMEHDTEQLKAWMTEPFITGGWRADGSDSDPAGALEMIYREYWGSDNHLELVQDADLKTLMGDMDPLSLPRPDAGVIQAVLSSGWGKDGRDEAILFIARAADNTLKWQGWIVVPGGFSGARLGGIQPYINDVYGYRVFVPADSVVSAESPEHVLIMAPGEGHPGQDRAAAFLDVEPANGRSVEEVVEQIKSDLGSGFNIPPGTALGLDKSMAIVLSGLPGQDVNRQLFVVYNDLLYHITFVPDTPQAGPSYAQMEDLYAMIVNTFHFTN